MLAPELFTTLAANASVLALWLGSDGRVHRVNRAFELVSGWSAAEAAGRLWPEDFGASRVELDPAHFSGKTSLPSRGPAGVGREVQWSGSVLPGESGVLVVGGVVAHTAAAHGQDAQRITKVGSWLAHDGRFDFSDELSRIFELALPRSEAAYEAMLATVHPDDREAVDRAFQRSLAEREPCDQTARLRMPDGRIKWVRARGEIGLDATSGTLRMFGTTQDVTETVLAQQELGAHSRALMSLAEGVLFMDAERIIRFTNPALDAMCGYESGELVGKHVSVLNTGAPDADADKVALLRKALNEQGAWDGELPCFRKDGSVFMSRLRVRFVDGPTGRLFVSILLDVTAERRATAAWLENARLETEARYGNDLLTELHHRVNNNLQLIASMLRLGFRDSPEGGVNATLASALHRVEAIALAHEHLSLAPSHEPRDMARHLNQLAGAILAIHGRSTSVSLDIEAPTLDLAPEDFMNLGMIANELLVNALQHGIGSRPSGRIQVSLEVGEASAKLVVVDEGPGIQPPATSTLGLQIVRQLARRMGGEARWAEAPGGGTRASVSFPLRAGRPGAAG